MEYIYAAMILHEAESEINEENVTAVLEAAGLDVEESRVKALVAALEDVDIEDAMANAAAMPAAAASTGGASGDADESEAADEEAEAGGDEDEEEDEEDVSGEGLGSLFG
ncbi:MULTISPECIES: 50S ribosomal protein P1 [unclassified Haladaptatus]|uniref:50S ribosomal protein P1 n=1 Tax=unclassified Haladaptatus TaxID=2622732 RepID=UPI0023E7ED9D|nr:MULTISPECIES: 50S ribosomal protein P1 [unclassified Haladaptatus]